jgi:hypothetical protein
LLVWVIADNHPVRKFYAKLGGQQILEKPIEIAGVPLLEIAYGWTDTKMIYP